MEISGLPVHPLIVHVVVVLAPIAALLAIAYAIKPGWRWALRGVLVVLALIAAVAGLIAGASGENLQHSLPGLRGNPTMSSHAQYGSVLKGLLLCFAGGVLVSAWRLGGPSGLTSGRGARTLHGGAFDLFVRVALVITALTVLVVTVLAGHSGASVLWG